MDQHKLLTTISKTKSSLFLRKLSPQQLMFLSQLFLHFTSRRYPVPELYRDRLMPHADIIRKFAHVRSTRAARKIAKQIPLSIYASICRWGLSSIKGPF